VGAAETPPRFASACACSESLRKGAVAHTTTSAIRNLLFWNLFGVYPLPWWA
jgi:hypothetical protein